MSLSQTWSAGLHLERTWAEDLLEVLASLKTSVLSEVLSLKVPSVRSTATSGKMCRSRNVVQVCDLGGDHSAVSPAFPCRKPSEKS